MSTVERWLGKKNHAHKVFDSDCFLLLCIKIFEHAQSSGALFAILCIETSQIIPCLLKWWAINLLNTKYMQVHVF